MKDKIFISHASKDGAIVDSLIDKILQNGLSVDIEQIFCTSADGTKIKSGEDWRDRIRTELLESKVIILIITPNYKESEMCMNEMGAAWVLDEMVIPLIVEPIDYDSVGILNHPNQVEKLLDHGSLDRLRDIIKTELGIPSAKIKSDRWSSKKLQFITEVKAHINAKPFAPSLDRELHENIIQEREDLEFALQNSIEENKEQKSIIEDLKRAKDKLEVDKIVKKYSDSEEYDEFASLCEAVGIQLEGFSPIVRGFIFRDWTRKQLKINTSMHESDISEAIAKNILSNDEEIEVKWGSNKDLIKLNQDLQNLSEYVGSMSEETYLQIEEEYDVSIDLNNLEFWLEMFVDDIVVS